MRASDARIVAGGILLKTAVCCACTAACLGLLSQRSRAADQAQSNVPDRQIIVCYFHRTVRCPTCLKIGAAIEQVVQAKFAEQLRAGTVRLKFVDFQNPKNKKIAEAYHITGPTLVILDVHGGKVSSWKTAPKVWSLVGKWDAFYRYVEDEIRSTLMSDRTAESGPGRR